MAKRPRKQTRDKHKQLVLQFLEEQLGNVEEAQDGMQALADESLLAKSYPRASELSE